MPDELHSLSMAQNVFVKKPSFWLGILPVLVLLACVIGLWWWIHAGHRTSSWAILDGMVYPITADRAGKVASLAVAKGDAVHEGQLLARLETSQVVALANDDSLRDMTRLRTMAEPFDREKAAARLQEAQKAEQEMAHRLAAARQEETTKRKQREDLVMAHVRAQLALRSLDAQGGERNIGKARYAAAQKDEEQARLAMEQAKAAAEQSSLVRAALDQEMTRMHEETLYYRQLVTRTRFAVPNYTRDALKQAGDAVATRQLLSDGSLHAPKDGTILRTLAVPGQMVQAGDPVALLLPQGEATYWIVAYFSQEKAADIKVGQKCSITLKDEKKHFSGKVHDIQEPKPLPEAAQGGGTGTFVPVRVFLDDADSQTLTLGAEAQCVVNTHNILP